MKSLLIPILFLLVFSISCGHEASTRSAPKEVSTQATAPAQKMYDATTASAAKEEGRLTPQNYAATSQKVSLSDVDNVELINEAADRKIIRNADITMEVPSTTEAQQRVTSIAEANGGFVVTSEAKQRDNEDPAKRTLDVKLVVRIPAVRFGPTLDEIKQLASNVSQANVTGLDVTEEFIDLEARIRTQKALELQFLEIMKQARKVEDALEVQRQVADVRTEIEKLEGRKRFLENRSSLSTITVNIAAPKVLAVVNPTGFGRTVREAVSESLELASGMLIFFIRFVIVMVPIFVFVLLPSGLILRYVMRRSKRMRLAQALATPTAD